MSQSSTPAPTPPAPLEQVVRHWLGVGGETGLETERSTAPAEPSLAFSKRPTTSTSWVDILEAIGSKDASNIRRVATPLCLEMKENKHTLRGASEEFIWRYTQQERERASSAYKPKDISDFTDRVCVFCLCFPALCLIFHCVSFSSNLKAVVENILKTTLSLIASSWVLGIHFHTILSFLNLTVVQSK